MQSPVLNSTSISQSSISHAVGGPSKIKQQTLHDTSKTNMHFGKNEKPENNTAS